MNMNEHYLLAQLFFCCRPSEKSHVEHHMTYGDWCLLYSPSVVFAVNPGVAVRSPPLSDHINPLVIKHGNGENPLKHWGVWWENHTCGSVHCHVWIYTGGYVKVSFLNNHTLYLLLFLRSNYTHSILVCLQTPSGPIQTRQVRSRHQANTLVFFVVRQPFRHPALQRGRTDSCKVFFQDG